MSYAHKMKPGESVHLDEMDPGQHDGLSREEAEAKSAELGGEMGELQELLFAAGQTSLLIVLQGRDTGGKDGCIRHLSRYMNVQSCQVAPFKVPTPEELSHDFLWRIHKRTPALGSVTIFNRSHYEDVLVVRVHELVPESIWRARYDPINAFEELLAANSTVLVKLYLHISKREQEERLLEREQQTEKAWKLNVGDWKEREFWDNYTEAYEDALRQCSTEAAPWYVVPANHKWFRDLAVTEAIVHALRPYRKQWMDHLDVIGSQARKELEAFRAGQ